MRLRSPTSPRGATSRRRTDPPGGSSCRLGPRPRWELPPGPRLLSTREPASSGREIPSREAVLCGCVPPRGRRISPLATIPARIGGRRLRGRRLGASSLRAPLLGPPPLGPPPLGPPPLGPPPLGPLSPPRDPEATPQRFSSGSTKTGEREQLQGAGRAEQESEEETPAGRIAGAARAGGDRRLVPSRWAANPSPVAGAPSVTGARKNGPCVCSGRTSAAPRTRGAGQESQEKAALREERVPSASERGAGDRASWRGPSTQVHCSPSLRPPGHEKTAPASAVAVHQLPRGQGERVRNLKRKPRSGRSAFPARASERAEGGRRRAGDRASGREPSTQVQCSPSLRASGHEKTAPAFAVAVHQLPSEQGEDSRKPELFRGGRRRSQGRGHGPLPADRCAVEAESPESQG